MLPVALQKFGFNQVNITNLLGQAQFCGANTNNVTVQISILGPLKVMTITLAPTVGAANQSGLVFGASLPVQYRPSQNISIPVTLTNSTASTYQQEFLTIGSNGALALIPSANLAVEDYTISHTFFYL
jgi:hypothetical protein